MSESSGVTRPDDPPIAYRDPLTATTDDYVGGSTAAMPTTGSGTGSGTGSYGTKDVAKDQAAGVAQEAKQSGAHVAGVAKEQAAGVAQEVGSQAKGLLQQGRHQVRQQASAQQQKAATGLKSVGDQISSLATGSPQPGVVTDLAHQASEQVNKIAQWVESREPSDLLEEVQRFARRRPGAFLAIAAGVGVVAGRLTRGVTANSQVGSQLGSGSGTYSGTTSSMGSDPYAVADPYSRTSPTGGTAQSGLSSTGAAGDLGYSTGTATPGTTVGGGQARQGSL